MSAPVEHLEPGPEAASEPVPPQDTGSAEPEELVLDDLLVEDVSIDGMCGVY